MTDINATEFHRGFVMHLDGSRLAQQENVDTNCEPGREVKGEHYFVLLEKLADDRWLVVPLFSQASDDRVKLEPRLKEGRGIGWQRRDSFFHPEQLWVVTEKALLAALSNDDSTRGSRRSYASKHTIKLDEIARFQNSNPRPFRRAIGGR